jgi:hypothetical protein
MKNLKKQIVPLSILVLSTFLFNCQTSVQNVTKVEKEKNIVSINKDKKIFSIKNTGPILFLPFNGDCNDCGISTLSFSDGSTTSMGALGSISIGADGTSTMSVGSRGGDLYSGPSSSVFASIGVTNPFNSGGGAIDTNGKPCISGGSNFHVDSSSPIDQTWYYKSGSINLSLQGYDLVGTVTGISSGNETALLAPWDGSCRPGETHTKYITNGTMEVRLKDVAFDPIALNVSKKLISLNPDNDSDLTSTDISVIASNKGTWDLSIDNKNIDSGTTNDKTITIDKDHTYGLSDGDYTNKVVLSATSGPQSVKDTLQIDSTKPEVVDINIDDSSDSIKIEVKIKDPIVNGFSSGIDTEQSKIESSLGGTSVCDGDKITYTLPTNTDFNTIIDSLSFDLKVILIDKAKNKYKMPIPSIGVTHSLSLKDENTFSTKYDHSLTDPNNNLSKVLFFPKEDKPNCSFKFSFINTYIPLNGAVFEKVNSIDLEYRIDKLKLIPLSNFKYIVRTLYKGTGLLKNSEYLYKGKYYLEKEKEVASIPYLYPEDPSDISEPLYNITTSKITHSFNSYGVNNSSKKLERGFYMLSTRKAVVKQGGSPPLLVKILPDKPLVFQVIDGATGNGPYSSLDDTDENFLDRGADKEFYLSQKDKIYELNREQHKSDINSFIDDWNNNRLDGNLNPNKIPLTEEQKERIVFNDDKNANKTLTRKNGENIDIDKFLIRPKRNNDPNMPTKFPYKQESEIDHIVPRKPKKECCETNGTNYYSNAQVSSKISNNNKRNDCFFEGLNKK